MSVLDETNDADDLSSFLAKPIRPVAKKVEHRRKTELDPHGTFDFFTPQKSRQMHSSLLATSKGSPKIILDMQSPQSVKKSKPSPIMETTSKAKNVGQYLVFMLTCDPIPFHPIPLMLHCLQNLLQSQKEKI